MENNNDIYTRTEMLVGSESLDILKNSTVAVIGIGGVGGTAFEALVRSGVGHIIIVDSDKVDETNLNRQILFLKNDVGQCKVEIAKLRANNINHNCEIVAVNSFLDGSTIKVLNDYHIDFIIDAIDAIYSKVELIKYALNNNIGIITSTGMGNRIDPSKLVVAKLNQSTGDPLAKKMRYLLKQDGVNLGNIYCVYSTELASSTGRTPSSMMMVPSACGLLLASHAIGQLIERKRL